MRLLLGTGGSRVAGATAGVALLLLLPGARKLLRAIPLSAVARMLFLRRS
jgi:MFS superfamily sulfate permease-like transporter